jgi:hypothetical protein
MNRAVEFVRIAIFVASVLYRYASDLQTFIGVNEMTSVVDGEV